MELHRSKASPTVTAPESTFTGDVQIGGYFRRESPSRLAGATVTFAPGARTPWKVNPLGQTIIVTSGIGYAQAEGQEIVEIRPGDVLWFPPGQNHWEGALPTQPMSYIAVQEEEGQIVQFLAAVTHNEYQPNEESA